MKASVIDPRLAALLAALTLALAALATAPARAEPGWFLGLGAGGGTAATATVFDDRATRAATPAYSSGYGEFVVGYRGESGLGLGFTGQSLSLAGLRRAGTSRADWSGELGGVTVSWRYERLDAGVSLLAGALGGDHSGDQRWDDERETDHTVAGAAASLGFTFYRGDAVDWLLMGRLEPLVVGGSLSPDGSLGRKLYLEQIGLGLVAHRWPGWRRDEGRSLWAGRVDCWRCDDLFVRGLLELGSAVGRATAEGLFRVLAR